MPPAELSRRRMLRIVGTAGAVSAAGVAAATAVATPATAASTSGSATADTVTALPSLGVVGTVADVRPDRLVLRVGRRSMVVVPTADASVYSGRAGSVSGIADMIVGDRVFVQGEDKGRGRVAASSIGSVYDNVVLRIRSVDLARGRVETSRGTLYLTGTLPDVGELEHRLPVGVAVTATTWTDPRDRRTYLLLTELDRIS